MGRQTQAKDEAQTETKSDVIAAEIEAVREADSLGETKFSKLFHEARTTGRNRASGVSLQVRVSDGEVEVHNKPVKTRQGEHLRGTDAWDAMVSIPVKPFMETRTARDEIVRQLRSWERNQSAKEQRQAEKAKARQHY